VFPLALSIVTSFMSAITVLGVPGDVPASNTAYVWFLLTFTIVCALTALVYVPVFYNMEIKSTYEYLNRRFGNTTRLMGVVAFLVQTALYLGIVIYAPALALSKTTGLNLWGVVVGTGIVCIIYTTLGGMKAVIWTGVFQALVMFGGFFAIIIFGCYDMGWGEIWRINKEEHRLDIWDFSTDIRQKHTFWTILFAGQMVWLSLYATSQAQVQRYMSSKTLKDAQLAIGINIVGLWFINAAALACGMVIFAFWYRCDPIAMGRITGTDQYLPYFVVSKLSHLWGVAGLHVSSVYAGSLSTVSSGINAMAMCTMEDFIKPYKTLSDQQQKNISMILVIVYGSLSILIAWLASVLGPVLQAALSILGILGGPLVAVFTMGIVFPFANQKGAICGSVAGVAFGWVIFGFSKADPKSSILKSYIPPHVDFAQCNGNWTNDIDHYLDQNDVRTSDLDDFLKTARGGEAACAADSSDMRYYCGWYENEINELNEEGIWERVYHMSYLYLSMFCFVISMVIGLAVSAATGGLQEDYRKSHSKEMFNTFFPTSYYCDEEDKSIDKEEDIEFIQTSKPF